MREISVATLIDAPPEVVWRILTDGASYGQWNSFIPRLEGRLAVGQRLRVRMAPPGGRPMTFRPTITRLESQRRLEWLGHVGIPGVFDGRHSFTLEALSDGRTRFIQGETFRGLLVPLMGTTLARTEAGFSAMNQALRTRAELRGHDAPRSNPAE